MVPPKRLVSASAGKNREAAVAAAHRPSASRLGPAEVLLAFGSEPPSTSALSTAAAMLEALAMIRVEGVADPPLLTREVAPGPKMAAPSQQSLARSSAVVLLWELTMMGPA